MSNCIRNYKFRSLQVSIFSFYVAVCIDCKMFVSSEMFIQRDMINVYLHLPLCSLKCVTWNRILFRLLKISLLVELIGNENNRNFVAFHSLVQISFIFVYNKEIAYEGLKRNSM